MSERRDEVLAALRRAGADGVSGEVLAGELGVSRAAVGKHVAALRALGYRIDARAGSGYVLVDVPDLLIAEEVTPLLRSPLWVRAVGFEQTSSTNDDAKRFALEGAPEGTVVMATRQTSGRGRLGRAWESPPGGVYFSAVLRPRCSIAELGPLPLVIALGVARGLRELGASPSLKWPNDVLLSSTGAPGPDTLALGKVAGVLLETVAEADMVEWVVAGVGMDVRRPVSPLPTAAYLSDEVDVTLARAAAAALDGIALAYGQFRAEGFSALKSEYESSLSLMGTTVTVRDLAGSSTASGRVTGVDELGRLMLEGPGGTLSVSTGDVTLR